MTDTSSPNDDSVGTKRVTVSAEALALIEWAKRNHRDSRGRSMSTADALDWLLRDLCEYGSPVVGAQARATWPDSVETNEWHRKHPKVRR